MLLLGLLIGSLSPVAAKDHLRVEFDESFDFSSVRTFDYGELADKNRGPVFAEAVALLQNRTTEALEAKGLQRVRENPDFLILFNGRMGDSVELIGGYRYGVGDLGIVWETWAGPGWSRSTSNGLVIVYMHLPDATEPYWGAGFSTELPQTVPSKLMRRTLERAVKRITKEYPPGA